jgi:Fic family protein
MKSFSDDFLSGISFTNNLLRTINRLGEFKGRQELFKKQAPEILENLLQVAIIQSTESSSRLEQVTADPARFKQLMAMKVVPKDRSEAEIAGYRDVLNTIHSSADHIPFNEKIVLQFHRDLMKYTPTGGGKWKNTQNEIIEKLADGSSRIRFTPVAPYQVQQYITRLHLLFDQEITRQKIEPLLLIPSYVLDFLCIHPFNDGNGRISRLLSLLLLYHSGYEVGRFISLERIIENTKESYYETLEHSSHNWHSGKHDPNPWINYFLSTLLAAYDEFEKRANVIAAGRGSKTQMVNNAIDNFISDFSIADIEKSCPLVGRDMIRHVLNRLRENGKIINISKGRYSRWRKI